ncbi:MAG: hypothetical protein PVI43_02465 [Candidatus Bathyarchaeota archaeon]|jgi:hypothetical protein
MTTKRGEMSESKPVLVSLNAETGTPIFWQIKYTLSILMLLITYVKLEEEVSLYYEK